MVIVLFTFWYTTYRWMDHLDGYQPKNLVGFPHHLGTVGKVKYQPTLSLINSSEAVNINFSFV